MSKDVVYAPIYNCHDCPHCDRSRYYTADSFEQVEAWNCTNPKLRCKYKAANNASTDRGVWHSPPGIARPDWNDKPPPIPKWCPFRKTKVRK